MIRSVARCGAWAETPICFWEPGNAKLQYVRTTTTTGSIISTLPAKNEFIPLETQIQQLMASLPENMWQRDWSMADLIARLSGKYVTRH